MRTSGQRRLASRLEDIEIVERASGQIVELGAELGRKLEGERRPSYRLRMLRETTNRITRAANDAVHAYTRASRGLRAELERPDVDVEAATAMQTRLRAARRTVLHAIEAANQRYGSSGAAGRAPETRT